jgi:glycosyltransferase involved in cell wall biosynthesis
MKFSVIICTYRRPAAVAILLQSIKEQTIYPDEILLIDGSPNNDTEVIIREAEICNLKYFRVTKKDRGLTRQRNFGIRNVNSAIDIICFLDDDIILTPDYFKLLLKTYIEKPNAIGVGGYILDQAVWEKSEEHGETKEFFIDGWKRNLGTRHYLRKILGLAPNVPPGYIPKFSNGYSIAFLPPNGRIYPVEAFMGGVSSFKMEIFGNIKFSEYFEGYGLYEDLEFCIRASRIGELYVNTSARLYHYHEESGRPNKFKYGKMVIRNGWYVWRVKYPQPNLKAQFKWHATAFLLTGVRLGNIITTSAKKEAFTEAMGRIVGWWSLIFNKPMKEND